MPDLKEKLRGLLPQQKKTPPIDDPAMHASVRYGCPFFVRNHRNEWRRWMSSCTTRQFETKERPYFRHCGPTAITNLILTLNRRYHILSKPGSGTGSGKTGMPGVGGRQARAGIVWYFPAASQVFDQVVRIGTRRGIYWNTDFLHAFGGTYDILTGMYIRACFREMGIEGFEIRHHLGSGPEDYLEALREGAVLYLQLHRDSCYGNHHVICYGAVETESTDRKYHRIYLQIADGWAKTPRYVAVEDMGFTHFLAIRRSEKY